MQDRYVETPLTAVASPPGLPETPAEQQVETHSLESGADKADGHVPTPAQKPGVALSKDAIDKRLRRVFQPRADGTYLVSEDFVKKYTARCEDREKLLIMFEKCDYAPDNGSQSWLTMFPSSNRLSACRNCFYDQTRY